MKVVQIQLSATSGGGLALKLHNLFLEAGIDSHVLSLHYDINDTDKVIYCDKKAKLKAAVEEKIHEFRERKNIKQYGLFTYPILGIDVSKYRVIREADIIYIHWVQKKFFNFRSFKKIARLGKPIVIVMHDMWYITGGCHHSFECEKYKTGCYNCQVFPGEKKNDLSTKGFKKKKKLYSGFNNFYFVSPSKWLKECAEASGLTRGKQIYLIPNVLNRKIFKAVDKNAARKFLNIEDSLKVISFGAVTIDSPYKGWEYLKDALQILKNKLPESDVAVLVFGKYDVSTMKEMIPFRTIFTGYLNDELSISMVYNAADVFVTPSIADNLPTTVLESLSCGTPVVGFRTGGIPDMIEHKRNGYLANYRDANDLAEGIIYCLENEIKGNTLPEFENTILLDKHMELINGLLNKS